MDSLLTPGATRLPWPVEPMLWTWTGYTRKDRRGHRPPQTPADVALCAQRRADRARMTADREACKAYPATLK